VYGVRSRYGPCPGFSVEVCKPNDLPPPITTHTKHSELHGKLFDKTGT